MGGVPGVGPERVELVEDRELRLEVLGRGVVRVLADEVAVLLERVVLEVRADDPRVERPLVLGVRRGVDADVAAARRGCTARTPPAGGPRGPCRSCSRTSRPCTCEVRRRERAGVLGRVDAEAVLAAEALDRGDADLDRVVAEARRSWRTRGRGTAPRWSRSARRRATDSARPSTRTRQRDEQLHDRLLDFRRRLSSPAMPRAMRSALAMIVLVGLKPGNVGNVDASAT